MNVLVTGATGFIGSHLVPRLIQAGDRVRALVRSQTDGSALAAAGAEVVRGDVRDLTAVERAATGCQVMYHLAKAHSREPHRTLESVNVEGTANVARAARRAGISRLIHASSAAIYGRNTTTLAVNEDSQVQPDSTYARSKAQAEQVLRAEHLRHGLPVVVARITGVLGPGSERWRPLFQSVAARRFRLPGPGANHHHTADVADIVDGLLLCGSQPGIEGRIYNLAGSEPIRLKNLVQLIAAELGMRGDLPMALPAAPFRVYVRTSGTINKIIGMSLPRAEGIAALLSDRILDTSRARQELGYAPRMSVSEALHRTAEWYRQEGWINGTAGAEAV